MANCAQKGQNCLKKKGSKNNVQNLPAQEEDPSEGTRLHEAYVHRKRKKGIKAPSCKGSRKTVLLMTERIKANRDFRRLFAKGKVFVSHEFVMYVLKNRKESTRVGVTCSKKIGNAVRRNRSKRVLREAFRSIVNEIPAGYDFIIVARSVTADKKSCLIAEKMRKTLVTAGIISVTE